MGIRSANDHGLSDPTEVVLLVCYMTFSKEEAGSGGDSLWVAKSKSGSVEQCVIGPQLSKDSAIGFTISCILSVFPTPLFIS